jgi:ribulose-phosphate 3-epimerase
MISSRLIPALIPNNVGEVVDFLEQLDGIAEVHIDVVDGRFVPYTSWPYKPVGRPKDVLEICQRVTLEIDLMVENRLPAAREWLEAGADMLVFHVETIGVDALREFANKENVTIGISALNETSFDELKPFLSFVDYVQVMGIAEIGAQGQPFDERALERINLLRAIKSDMNISLDGSVNKNTLPSLANLRLSRYVVGSAVTKAPVPKEAYRQLCDYLSSTG